MSAPTKDELFNRMCNAFLYWDKIDPQFFSDNPDYFATDIEHFAKQVKEYHKSFPGMFTEDK